MKEILLTLLILGKCISAFAQCSEAENQMMRKYAELTRNSTDTQGCSQCAWLANLFCIAENGLYENDRTGVEKAINDTKANIRTMGTTCCPELLTQTIIWGQPQGYQKGQLNSKNNSTESTSFDVQQFANEVNNAMNTIGNLNALEKTGQQLQKDLEVVEKLMKENSVLSRSKHNSKEEIYSEYNIKLTNLNKLADAHLVIKTKLQSLGYSSAGTLMNNSNSRDLGLIVGLGALASNHKKESRAYSESLRSRLEKSKETSLNKLDFDYSLMTSLISYNFIEKVFFPYANSTSDSFYNSAIVPGWRPGMKRKEFKKLLPKGHSLLKQNAKKPIIKYKFSKLIKHNGKFGGMWIPDPKLLKGDILLNKKDVIGQVIDRYVENQPLTNMNCYNYQQKISKIIQEYSEIYQKKPQQVFVFNYNFKDDIMTNLLNSYSNKKIYDEEVKRLKDPEFKEKFLEALYESDAEIFTRVVIRWDNQIDKSSLLEINLIRLEGTLYLMVEKVETNSTIQVAGAKDYNEVF